MPPPPAIGTDGLKVSPLAASATRSEPGKLADMAERARLAAGAAIPPVGLALAAERAKPGTLRRIAAGAAVALSPVWAPLGMLWQVGLNLGQGLRKKEFSPIKSFKSAADSVGKEMSLNWGIATGTSHRLDPVGAAAKAGSAASSAAR